MRTLRAQRTLRAYFLIRNVVGHLALFMETPWLKPVAHWTDINVVRLIISKLVLGEYPLAVVIGRHHRRHMRAHSLLQQAAVSFDRAVLTIGHHHGGFLRRVRLMLDQQSVQAALLRDVAGGRLRFVVG